MAFYQTRLVTEAVEAGYYTNDRGEQVDWKQLIVDACVAKRSIPPWQALTTGLGPRFESTEVQVSNEAPYTIYRERRICVAVKSIK